MAYPVLALRKDQERRLLAGHVWVYANEVDTARTALTGLESGQLVDIISAQGRSLGLAYVNPHTLLCARLLTHDSKQPVDGAFFYNRLYAALRLREVLYSEPYYRWVFSESDFLPGLIIDRFDDTLVIQINTAGMDRFRSVILDTVVALVKPRTVVWRNDSPYRALEGLTREVSVAYGQPCDTHRVIENNCEFIVSLEQGQKTGWFYDHRENRHRIARHAVGKSVLDLFSYAGGFGIPAAKAGAQQVTCVDSSPLALDYVKKNAERNGVAGCIEPVKADVFEFLQAAIDAGTQYDLIISDPPAFIKKKKEYYPGLKAYEKLHTLCLSVLAPSGVLLAASCSMHCSGSDFLNTLRGASIKTKKQIRIIESLHQGWDHPVHPAIPETNYLKGFIAVA